VFIGALDWPIIKSKYINTWLFSVNNEFLSILFIVKTKTTEEAQLVVRSLLFRLFINVRHPPHIESARIGDCAWSFLADAQSERESIDKSGDSYVSFAQVKPDQGERG